MSIPVRKQQTLFEMFGLSDTYKYITLFENRYKDVKRILEHSLWKVSVTMRSIWQSVLFVAILFSCSVFGYFCIYLSKNNSLKISMKFLTHFTFFDGCQALRNVSIDFIDLKWDSSIWSVRSRFNEKPITKFDFYIQVSATLNWTNE